MTQTLGTGAYNIYVPETATRDDLRELQAFLYSLPQDDTEDRPIEIIVEGNVIHTCVFTKAIDSIREWQISKGFPLYEDVYTKLESSI